MPNPPTKYIRALESKFCVRGIRELTFQIIQSGSANIHFTGSTAKSAVVDVCCFLAKALPLHQSSQPFPFEIGSRVVKSVATSNVVKRICRLLPSVALLGDNNDSYDDISLENYIPLTSYGKRCKPFIEGFEKAFGASSPSNYYCYHKLVVLADKRVFQDIDGKHFPACFVSDDDKGGIEIEYNSPVIPKIVVLKSLQFLDCFTKQYPSKFTTCVVIGARYLDGSINSIRRRYYEQVFNRILIFTSHPMEVEIGRGIELQHWNWTAPEIAYFEEMPLNEIYIEEVINTEFDRASEFFFQTLKTFETIYSLDLSHVLRFFRRLCYDWSLSSQSERFVLENIAGEFKSWILPWLQETVLRFKPDANCDNCAELLAGAFDKMVKSLRTNNKSELFRTLDKTFTQIVAPAGWVSRYNEEIRILGRRSKGQGITLNTFSALSNLTSQPANKCPDRQSHMCIIPDTTVCIPSTKIKDVDIDSNILITSIYRNGSIEKLIANLTYSTRHFTLMLYGPERRAWDYHNAQYHRTMQEEWSSKSRFELSGVKYENVAFSAVNLDDWITDMESPLRCQLSEYVCIHFASNKKERLPAERGVLRIDGNKVKVQRAGDLQVGDEVRIYTNNSRELIGRRISKEHPEIARAERYFAEFWVARFLHYYRSHLISRDELYRRLKEHNFSVSRETMEKYLAGEVGFPRRYGDLIAIARTIVDPEFNDNVLREMLGVMNQYDGKAVSYGQQIAEAINNYIISGEVPDSLASWLTEDEVRTIAAGIPTRKVVRIDLLTTNETSDDE